MAEYREKTFYVQHKDGVKGPYTLTQLRRLADQRVITPNTKIRTADGDGWTLASQVPQIFGNRSPLPQNDLNDVRPSATVQSPVRMSPPAVRPSAQTNPSKSDYLHGWFAIIGATAAIIILCLFVVFSAKNNSVAVDPFIDDLDSSNSTAPSESTENLVAKVEPAVALIETSDGSGGSGFAFEPNLVATNFHVIATAYSDEIFVAFPSVDRTRRIPARIVAESPQHDLAILWIDARHATVKLDSNYQFRRGQDIVVMGSPGGPSGQAIENAVTKGVMSAEVSRSNSLRYQISTAVNPGNSGGPVFGMDGKVIGIVDSKALGKELINYAVPVCILVSLVNALPLKPSAGIDQEHNIRRTLVLATNDIEEFQDQVSDFSRVFSEVSGTPLFQCSTGQILEGYASLHDVRRSAIFPNRHIEFEGISHNLNLNSSTRREIGILAEQHQAIGNLVAAPPANFFDFLDRLKESAKAFCEQLHAIDEEFPILISGQP